MLSDEGFCSFNMLVLTTWQAVPSLCKWNHVQWNYIIIMPLYEVKFNVICLCYSYFIIITKDLCLLQYNKQIHARNLNRWKDTAILCALVHQCPLVITRINMQYRSTTTTEWVFFVNTTESTHWLAWINVCQMLLELLHCPVKHTVHGVILYTLIWCLDNKCHR